MLLRTLFPTLIALFLLPLANPAEAAPQETVEAIMEEITTSKDKVNERLFERLAAIGDEASFNALKTVPKLLSSQEMRDAAYAAFVEYTGQGELELAAIEFLVHETNGRSTSFRRGAAKGLALFEEVAESEMEVIAKKNKDPLVRAYVARALLPMWTSRQNDSKLTLLLEACGEPATAKHDELVAQFSKWDRPQNTKSFCRVLGKRKGDVRMKRVIIAVIVDREHEDVPGALAAALGTHDPLTQYRALVALDKRGETLHEGQLKKLSNSDDEAVRMMAVVSMAKINAEDPAFVKKIQKFARHKNPATRQGAIVALAILGTPEARVMIEHALADEDRLVRLESIKQLFELRVKQSLPALIARLEVETGRARDELTRGLRMMTALDNGNSYQRWSRWWDGEGEAFVLPSVEDAIAAEKARKANKDKAGTVASFYGLEAHSDRIAFVMDTSGSMNNEQRGGTRMDVAKEELVKSLEQYPGGAWFNLIFFSSEVTPWKAEMVKMDDYMRSSALDYVSRQGPGGATAIYDALRSVFNDREVDTIFLLTDGEPQGGTEDSPMRIREAVMRWNLTRGIQIHCVSIGRRSALLKELAEDSGGEYREVQ